MILPMSIRIIFSGDDTAARMDPLLLELKSHPRQRYDDTKKHFLNNLAQQLHVLLVKTGSV